MNTRPGNMMSAYDVAIVLAPKEVWVVPSADMATEASGGGGGLVGENQVVPESVEIYIAPVHATAD